MDQQPMRLTIPASPEYVGTARLFVAEVGRHFGIDQTTIGDVKVAMSEACNGAIAMQALDNEDGIAILARSLDTGVRFDIISSAGWAPTEANHWDPSTPTDSFQKVLGIGIIQGLFPDARFDDAEAGVSLTFTVTASTEEATGST
ncbi:MAG: ATP-binding protein [Actinomycetota bacterium]|nr:ATP-binding protein [Actinomycetota bacterium]